MGVLAGSLGLMIDYKPVSMDNDVLMVHCQIGWMYVKRLVTWWCCSKSKLWGGGVLVFVFV